MATINRNKVRQFLQNYEGYRGYRLAALQVYQDLNTARAVIFSRNNIFYEVWLKMSGDAVEVVSEDLLVPYSDINGGRTDV